VNDRLYFTPDEDPLFGALLFAYADLLELNKLRSAAKEVRGMAKSRGYDPGGTEQQGTVARSSASNNSASYADLFAWLGVSSVVVIAFAFVWRNRKA
jgi:hypothetical protein